MRIYIILIACVYIQQFNFLCSITYLWHGGQHLCRAIGRLQVRISLGFWLLSERRSLWSWLLWKKNLVSWTAMHIDFVLCKKNRQYVINFFERICRSQFLEHRPHSRSEEPLKSVASKSCQLVDRRANDIWRLITIPHKKKRNNSFGTVGVIRVNANGSNRPPVPWVESSPFGNWVEWTWVDIEKCQVQGRQHIDFDPSPFDPIRPQSIRLNLFDQKGRPNSFRPISCNPRNNNEIKISRTFELLEKLEAMPRVTSHLA